MAIDFPNTPVNGSTYTYLGVTYTYSKSGGDEGFWQVTTPGSVGIATPAEISAGADAIKYITPLGLYSTVEWVKLLALPEPSEHINWAVTGAEKIHKERYVSPRVWCNFNGTGTPAIKDSLNVSSLVDGGTGVYTINFIEDMLDTNYAFLGSSLLSSGAIRSLDLSVKSVGSVIVLCQNTNNTNYDTSDNTMLIIGEQ